MMAAIEPHDESFFRALADRYRVERVLGRGGMATVYLAQDVRHDRPVAVKVLPFGATAPARFLQEIRIASQLSHPHIVTLHDSGEIEGRLFYVMPYIAGESLRERLRRDTRLSVEDTLRLARELAEALRYAHQRAIIHRDIKPENILLHEGHAMLADFGIARALSEAAGDVTRTGFAVGTLAYMSPEQLAGSACDARTDVYALGCVLFECLAGQPVHRASGGNLLGHVSGAVPSVRDRRPEIDPGVDHVIQRALAPDLAARWESADALAAALTAETAPAGRRSPSAIVVLPFANVSPDADNEYFSDGLTEEISADLGRLKSLKVISRTSASRFKATSKDLRTIARELGVSYVLEGSVRKSGSALRITAQLIDAAADAQLWGDKFSGTVDDVFDLQERVSREIVKALRLTLTSDEDRELADRPIRHPQAFELFLRARQQMRRYGDGPEHAIALIAQAVTLEGNTPPLRALKGWAQVAGVKAGLTRDDGILAGAEDDARSILAEAPSFPPAHSLLAYVQFERGNLAEAVRHFGVALSRDPADSDALLYLGLSYAYAGQLVPARAVADRLLTCDPLGSFSWVLLGCTRWQSGDFLGALGILGRSIELDEQNFMGHWCMGYACAAAGNLSQAVLQLEWLERVGPHVPYTAQLGAIVDAMRGDQQNARSRLAAFNAGQFDQHLTFHLAESHAVAGSNNEALEFLESSIVKGFYPVEYIESICPFLRPIRSEPPFPALVAMARRRQAAFASDTGCSGDGRVESPIYG